MKWKPHEEIFLRKPRYVISDRERERKKERTNDDDDGGGGGGGGKPTVTIRIFNAKNDINSDAHSYVFLLQAQVSK